MPLTQLRRHDSQYTSVNLNNSARAAPARARVWAAAIVRLCGGQAAEARRGAGSHAIGKLGGSELARLAGQPDDIAVCIGLDLREF
jgi:hypothetical protein